MKETKAQRMRAVAREIRRRRRAEGTSQVILCGCDAALFPDEVREDKEQREADANDKNDKNDGQDETTARTRTRSRSRSPHPSMPSQPEDGKTSTETLGSAPRRSRNRSPSPSSPWIKPVSYGFAKGCKCWVCGDCAPARHSNLFNWTISTHSSGLARR